MQDVFIFSLVRVIFKCFELLSPSIYNIACIKPLTIPGSAAHPLFFITCHTTNHIGFIFHHLRSCKRSGFSSNISCSRFLMSSSETGVSHFSSIITAGSLPELSISQITILA